MKASQVIAESADTLCSQPDLVATDPKYAWGTAIWFWLFNSPTGEQITCHTKALEGSFGDTLRIINGGLECPPDPNGYHAEAVVTRLRYYCIASSVMGVNLLSLDGCKGLGDAFDRCVKGGYCPECNEHYGKSSTMEPSPVPAPKGPTPKPSEWGSWKGEQEWMSMMRGNTATKTASSVFGILTTVTAYLLF
jgi:hypothetical protein